MSKTWHSPVPQVHVPITKAGWIRVVLRGLALAMVTLSGLAVLLLVRLVERPVWDQHRPWTPIITVFVCRMCLRILGLRHGTSGQIMREKGAVVSNHATWLDIFVLNAQKRVYFVSKSEVANWPGIGWLARATGTVFIERNPKDALEQKRLFQARLNVGHRLLFFPEGTSTDSQSLTSFKSTLFAAFFEPELYDKLWIQPTTVRYTAPKGQDARFYGWWGDMDFAENFVKILAAPRQGRVDIIYHAPLKVSDYQSRKILASDCKEAVKLGFETGQIATAPRLGQAT
ncbi:MAG: lysophospholipid acyltransferase family protein [Marinosulfonomonas sp.]